MPSVLITRPLALSESLAVRLQSLGYETAIEPLLAIRPTHAPPPVADSEAIMITSGHALPALASEIAARFLDLPCYCVGARTAEKAGAFGFRDIRYADGDGATLARLIDEKRQGRKTHVLHISGRTADPKAKIELERLGHDVIGWPVYEAVAAAHFSDMARQSLQGGSLDAALFFSARTASVFRKLLAEAALEACCQRLAAICLSEAIADKIKPLGWRCIIAAPQPAEDAVIACLQAFCTR